MLHQLFVKLFFEIKDGTFIGYGMDVGNSAFISRLGDNNTAIIRIQRITKDIKQEISFANETDSKGITVFRFGRIAILAFAFKIKDAVKIGLV